MPSFTRSIAGRAIHLRIIPRPENLAQSTEIYRWLKRCGPVEYYKNLKYERLSSPTSALAILRDADVATRLIKQSPLRLTMEIYPETRTARTVYSDTDEDSSTNNDRAEGRHEDEEGHHEASDRHTSQADGQVEEARQSNTSTPTSPFSSRKQDKTPFLRDFSIQINASTYNHRDHINVSPYHGPYAVNTKSAIQEDLAKTVPLRGLSEIDLKKPEKPWRVMAWQAERERKTRRPLMEMIERARREMEERGREAQEGEAHNG